MNCCNCNQGSSTIPCKKLGERRKKYAKFVSSQSKAKNSLSQWYHYGLIYCPSLLVRPVSSGMIQFRISESLNHLVVFNRKLMWGVLGGVIFLTYFWFRCNGCSVWWSANIICVEFNSFLQKKVPSIPVRMCLNSLFFTVSMFLLPLC